MTKATILIIENDPDFHDALAKLLLQNDYQVVETSNLQNALTKLETEKIDLAVIDFRLEDDLDEQDQSGMTFAIELPTSLPKIILFDEIDYQSKKDALMPRLDISGAIDFVIKTDGPNAFLAVIRRALRTSLSGDSTTNAPPPEGKKKRKDESKK